MKGYTVHQLAWLACIVGLLVLTVILAMGADLLRAGVALVLQFIVLVIVARGSVVNG